mgnify:CR=1 FL=1
MKAGTSSMKNHVFDKEQFGIEGKVSVVASFDNETFCVLKIHSQEYIILRGNGSGMFSNLLDIYVGQIGINLNEHLEIHFMKYPRIQLACSILH